MIMETKKDFTAEDLFKECENNITLHSEPKNFDTEEFTVECYDEDRIEDYFYSEKLEVSVFTVLSERELSVCVEDEEEPWHWDLNRIGFNWKWVGA